MADPTVLDASALHPCQYCAGARTLSHYPWRDPGYWVECTGCDNKVAGSTEDDAREGWNAVNGPRDVAPEDVMDVEAARLQPLLTDGFLHTLQVAHQTYVGANQPPEAHHFVDWCATLAGKEL
jgi:hypothetical protein